MRNKDMAWTYTAVTIYKGTESKGYGEMCMQGYMQDRVREVTKISDEEVQEAADEGRYLLGIQEGFDASRLENAFENDEDIEEFCEHSDCLSGDIGNTFETLEIRSTHPQFNLCVKYLEEEYYDWGYSFNGDADERILLDADNNCEIENLEKFKELMNSYDEFIIEFCVFQRYE